MAEPETGLLSVLRGIRQRIETRLAAVPVDDCPGLDSDNWCDVQELLRHRDGDFVRNAYRTMLRREPDWASLELRVLALRSGGTTRLQIIRDLAESPEGRTRRVRLIGFDWHSFTGERPEENPDVGGGEPLPPMMIHDWWDLERQEGRDFIAGLFRLVLGLEPDESMVTPWLEILQAGCQSKRDIITAFLGTAEGRGRWVFVKRDPENNRSVELLIERNNLLEGKLKGLEEDCRRALSALGGLTSQMRERAEHQDLLLARMRLEQERMRGLLARDWAASGSEP